MPQGTPTFPEMLRAAVNARLMDVHVAIPGKVESYDAAKQVADIRPMIPRVLPNTDDDQADVLEDLPVVPAVPVLWPRGRGYFLHLGLEPGDTVLLVFCERDLTHWRQTGDGGDPGDRRMHSLASAVAIPGLFPAANPIADSSGKATLGKDGGPNMGVDATYVLLGSLSPADFVALASKVDTELTKIATTLATGSNSGGPVVFGTPYSRSGVGSAKVKAE